MTAGFTHLQGVRDHAARFSLSTQLGEPSPDAPELGPCLIFLGALQNGYGQFGWMGRKGYAHRYAWEQANGPIPEGLTVDHLCRVRNCVEVAHMELVGGVENFYRAMRAKTTCKYGHEYDQPFEPGKRRRCPVCKRRYWEKQARARKAAGGSR